MKTDETFQSFLSRSFVLLFTLTGDGVKQFWQCYFSAGGLPFKCTYVFFKFSWPEIFILNSVEHTFVSLSFIVVCLFYATSKLFLSTSSRVNFVGRHGRAPRMNYLTSSIKEIYLTSDPTGPDGAHSVERSSVKDSLNHRANACKGHD